MRFDTQQIIDNTGSHIVETRRDTKFLLISSNISRRKPNLVTDKAAFHLLAHGRRRLDPKQPEVDRRWRHGRKRSDFRQRRRLSDSSKALLVYSIRWCAVRKATSNWTERADCATQHNERMRLNVRPLSLAPLSAVYTHRNVYPPITVRLRLAIPGWIKMPQALASIYWEQGHTGLAWGQR